MHYYLLVYWFAAGHCRTLRCDSVQEARDYVAKTSAYRWEVREVRPDGTWRPVG